MEITAVSAHTTSDGTAYSMTVQFTDGKEVVTPLHEMQYKLLMEAMHSAQEDDLLLQPNKLKVLNNEDHLNKLIQTFNRSRAVAEESVPTFQSVEESDSAPMDLGEQIPLRGGLGGVKQL